MRVIWTARARAELDELADYLSAFGAATALGQVRLIRSAATLLGEHPHKGRLGRVDESRELIVSGTPYILPYRVRDGRVEILAVIHMSRQWPNQL